MTLPKNSHRAFLDSLGGQASVDEVLASALSQVVERAHRKWPTVRFDDDAFLARLGERARDSSSTVALLSRLRTSDLFVAWAAERGDDAAIAAIMEHSRATLLEALAPLRLSADERDDVLQRLRARVFVGAPPRIGTYSGTGSLATWLSAVAVRLAVDLKRASKPEEELDEQLAASVADTSNLELAVIRRQYQAEFKVAFQDAFRALTLDERNLVRLTFIDRLSIDALAAMMMLHRSTVARRIAALRDELAKGTRKRLQERFKLNPSDVNSLMRVVVSAFDASLSSLLADGTSLKSKPK